MLLPPLLTIALIPFRDELNLVSDMLLFLLLTVVVALVGGLAPALIAAVAGSMLLNYYFTPPLHTLTISETNNTLALLVFVLVAALVSSAVDLAARRTRQAARAAAESRTLANLAGSVLVGEDGAGRDAAARPGDLRPDLGHPARTQRRTAGSPWPAPARAVDTPERGGHRGAGGETGSCSPCADRRCAPRTSAWSAPSPRRLPSCVDHLRLSRAAAEAGPLAEANKVRTALLAAVGHDFRTPLAAAKAAVSSLLSLDIRLDAEDRHELLARPRTTSLDRLAALVDNLLDMSRLQAGAMSIDLQPTARRRGHRPSPRRPRRRRGPHRRRPPRRPARWSTPTRDCSSGCSPTSPRTRCDTRPPRRPRT